MGEVEITAAVIAVTGILTLVLWGGFIKTGDNASGDHV